MASKNFKPISQADIDKYWEIFSAYCQGASTITGSQASTILRNSGLPDDSLAKIWDLADIDRDGNLDFEEFCVCMRLIYDVMNGDLKGVPAVLPDFLVPESKAHLVTANSAMAGGGEQFEQPEEDEDDTPGLRDGFDWYMQPKDRAKYEGIYTANAGQHGQLAFGALGELYDEISVPDTDVNNAWNLVNPSRTPTIGKDQALTFLHILAQRHEGFRVPRSVPPSLRATFEKNQITYDLDKVPAPAQRRSGPDINTPSGKKAAFGESYITRLGIGGGGTYKHSGTDFTATRDKDWEEVRLKRELTSLETKIADAEAAVERRRTGAGGGRGSRAALVKRELEQMLDYKRTQLRELDDDSDAGGAGAAGKSLKTARDDLDMLKQQVDALEEHLRSREGVLNGLLAQVGEEKAQR